MRVELVSIKIWRIRDFWISGGRMCWICLDMLLKSEFKNTQM